MKLWIVRHADAEPVKTRDADRALTSKGQKQAQALASYLKGLRIKPDAILSSPYVRARQTAEALSAALLPTHGLIEEKALGCGMMPEDIRDVLVGYGEEASVMLVGHEPDLSTLISWLCGQMGGGIEMKKCSFAALDLATVTPGGAMLQALIPPQWIS